MISDGLETWLARGERGISSETMVEKLEGMPRGTLVGRWGWKHPLDPADLRRCLLLLRAVPSYRERLGELAEISWQWAALVGAWAELEALLIEELGPDLGYGKAPKTYDRMHELCPWEVKH